MGPEASVMSKNSNNGAHVVATIRDTVEERMALYDAMPKPMRDAMKALAFNYSAVGMADIATVRGIEGTVTYMKDFDRKHWRAFFADEIGAEYPGT